jgi:hypothetical protein
VKGFPTYEEAKAAALEFIAEAEAFIAAGA